MLKMNTDDHLKNKNSSNDEVLNEFTKEIYRHAVSFEKKVENVYFGLDYSVNSLIIVDKILEDASIFYNQMDEGQLNHLVTTAGSYIFEVARRNFGGKYFWYDNLNQPILVTGQPAFEMSLLAFEKVKGRLINGSEDNIPYFFEGYANGVKNKKSAMIV